MHRCLTRMLYLWLAVLIVLSACGEADAPTPAPAPDAPFTPDPVFTSTPGPTPTTVPHEDGLRDIEWILIEIEGKPPLGDARITLELTDDGASGYSGCNWYYGPYVLSGETIHFEEVVATIRGCSPNSLLTQEYRYHELLRETERLQVSETELVLMNAEGAATLVFIRRQALEIDPAVLIGTTWRLMAYDGIVAVGPPALLTFDDASHFSTRDGCYNYAGTYVATGDRLTFPTTSAAADICLQPGIVQSGVATLLNALNEVASYRISDDGSQLELTHIDGRMATFARMTDLPPSTVWAVTWVLDSIVVGGSAEQLLDGFDITLTISTPSLKFGESRNVTGSSGCNTYHAVMTAGANIITFSDIIVTEMACLEPVGVMDQEQRYLELLGKVTSHNFVEEGALQLVTDDGATLVFHPAG
jgi:heat shock protein HslJ